MSSSQRYQRECRGQPGPLSWQVPSASVLIVGLIGILSAAEDSWVERIEKKLHEEEQAGADWIHTYRTRFDYLRHHLVREGKRLASEGEAVVAEDVERFDELAAQTIALLEGEGEKLMEEMGTELSGLTRAVENEIDAEYERLKDQLAPYLEEGEDWLKRTEREVEGELANVAEEGLSEARRVLRDLSDHSPPPQAAPTIPNFDSALSDEAIPLQTSNFPPRPAPLLELGPKFFGAGYIDPGFQIPTGATWQPQFFLYGLMRSGVQTFDDGVDPRTTQWVNSLELYVNLNLTPTERILVEFRPLDNEADFSGYNFEGPEVGWQNALNGRLYTLFFEGNFLSLFPNLDDPRNYLLGFDFSIGRQELFLQSGVLLNDSIDMVGITHPSLFWLGGSATTATFVYAWGNVHRGNGVLADTAQFVGGYLRNDYHWSTVEVDLFYSTANQADGGDGFYAAASAIQRIGRFNTNLTLAGSVATNRREPTQESVNTGGLVFGQISTDVVGTENILYLNGFWAIERFTSVSRSPAAGGPLGQTGLLFAATGLGDFGAALGSSGTSSAGAALGYQIFFDNLYRKQLILEVGAQTETSGPTQKSVAAGVQYSQAFGQHWVVTVGGIGALQQDKSPLYGLRMEIDFSF